MNKGRVSSEELRLQLGESLPNAIGIFARAMGVSEAELFKMMEQGQVLASDILPKVAKEMSRVANSGGALEEKYKTARVAQGRFFTQLEQAQNTLFQGGMDEGIGSFFNDLAHSLKELAPTLQIIGKVFKVAFVLIGSAIRLVAVPLQMLSSLVYTIADALVNFREVIVVGLGVAFLTKMTLISKAVTAMSMAFKGLTGRIMLAIGALLMLEDVWMSADNPTANTQVNRWLGNVNEDGTPIKQEANSFKDITSRINNAYSSSKGRQQLMDFLFKSNNPNVGGMGAPIQVTIAADSQGLIKVVDQRVGQQYSFAEAVSN